MAEHAEAVSALTRLGFTAYEAKVFVALQRLGTGTARAVHRTTDVPRSQVYSVAEHLEADGFLSIQHSTPREYRPIAPSEARDLLASQFERDLDVAMEYIEAVEGSRADEQREDIWTVRGKEAIGSRVVQLVDGATERVILAVRDDSLLTGAMERTLRERAAGGVHVVVICDREGVVSRFTDVDIEVVAPPDDVHRDEHTGLLLVVDRDTVLHSVLAGSSIDRETAYWSSGSTFASTFVSLMERTLDDRNAP